MNAPNPTRTRPKAATPAARTASPDECWLPPLPQRRRPNLFDLIRARTLMAGSLNQVGNTNVLRLPGTS